MINDGQVYLAGYVASPPAFKISNGKPTTTVRVAFTPRWRSRETGEWADGPTSFVNVSCWRTLATHVAMSLHKGEPVLVMGRLRVRRYADKEGAPRTAVEVEANSIGHDLTRGVTMFSRLRRPAGETADEAAVLAAQALLAAQAGANGMLPGGMLPGGEAPGSADGEGPDAEALDRADGPDLDGAGLDGADLDGAGPDGAGLDGADLDGADPGDVLDGNAVAALEREMAESLSEAGLPS